MPKRFEIELSDDERTKLERWVKNPPRPYLRKRARAILMVAAGNPAYKVATSPYVRVHRTTVTDWVQRFQADRLKGLMLKPGRGRKASFPPQDRGSNRPTGSSPASVAP